MLGFRSFALAGVAALGMAGWSTPARQSDDAVMVRAVRFYRAESNITQVKAFVQIPLNLLQPTEEREGGILSYQVSIQVKDSTGLTLEHDAWPQQHVAADLREPGAFTVNVAEFPVRPGKYRVDVTLRDSVAGREYTAGTNVIGFGQSPDASDLVLSPRMRPIQGDSMDPTEFKSGQFLVTSVARLRLTPLKSTAFYLLEVYHEQADSGSMRVAISDSSGGVVVQTPPNPIKTAAGGGVLRGQLNLEGLPAGDYTLKVSVAMADGRTFDRSARFTMANLQRTVTQQAIRSELSRITDSGYFAAMSEEQLDNAEEPLQLIASGRDLRAYKGATLTGKRRFMTEFWQKRDPDPSTERNEARERFYGAIQFADSNFRELGQSTIPGWKTDRGRIFTKYGLPDDSLHRVQPGLAPPYLVWRYTRGKGYWYIFADRNGLGAFKLIHTNDLAEAGRPDWMEIIGADAVRDVGQFLGIDFFSAARSPEFGS